MILAILRRMQMISLVVLRKVVIMILCSAFVTGLSGSPKKR